MRKLSQKIILYSIKGILATIILSACMDPVNIKDFLEDETILDKIDRDRVNLIDKSGDNLRVGNQRITGLKPANYYRVEEQDENEEPAGKWFVSRVGSLVQNFNQLGRVTDGAIENLDNTHYYTVFSATPLTGKLTLYEADDIHSFPSSGITINLNENNSGITRSNTNKSYFLDFRDFVKNDHTYETRKFVNPPSASSPVSFFTDTKIFKLEANDTLTDYIILEKDASGEISDFRILTVLIGTKPPPGDDDFGLKIEITFEIIDGAPVLTPNEIPISEFELSTKNISINLSNASDFTNIQWKLQGEIIGTGGNLNIDVIDIIEHLSFGTNIITIIAEKEGIHYSTILKIIIN